MTSVRHRDRHPHERLLRPGAPDAEADADPSSSEGRGLCSRAPSPAGRRAGQPRAGDGHRSPSSCPARTTLQPPVTELTGPAVVQLSTGNPLPTPIPITAADLPVGGSIQQLERLQGMRVSVATLIVWSRPRWATWDEGERDRHVERRVRGRASPRPAGRSARRASRSGRPAASGQRRRHPAGAAPRRQPGAPARGLGDGTAWAGRSSTWPRGRDGDRRGGPARLLVPHLHGPAPAPATPPVVVAGPGPTTVSAATNMEFTVGSRYLGASSTP